MDSNFCWNCRYWKSARDVSTEKINSNFGECRRNPPQVTRTVTGRTSFVSIKDATTFPVVNDIDWCGQHQP
jgi:hypothetical protein